jgi:hypothetical protein
MGSRRNYHFRRRVMSLQLVAFATVRGIVQKILAAHVNHQDHSAPLFLTREGDIILSLHFYMSYEVMMTPAMINNTLIAIVSLK